MVAALMAIKPQFSRAGWRRLPRMLRALRGWRILSPSLSRKPWEWAVWAALATELVRMQEPLMAIYVIMLVDGYFRPGELLGLQRGGLLPPTHATGSWTVLLFP